jgi:hypothetical protein
MGSRILSKLQWKIRLDKKKLRHARRRRYKISYWTYLHLLDTKPTLKTRSRVGNTGENFATRGKKA